MEVCLQTVVRMSLQATRSFPSGHSWKTRSVCQGYQAYVFSAGNGTYLSVNGVDQEIPCWFIDLPVYKHRVYNTLYFGCEAGGGGGGEV